MRDYPDGFPNTTEPPIINYAIEKIGDYIHHHNNASPDPIIVYAYEGKNRALWELRRRLAHAEQLSVLSAPYYTLRLNDIIRVEDSLLELNENYEIRGLSIPLNGEYMNINAVKVKNLIVDIPYFDNTHPKANACWYNYDTCGLAFTYNYWRTRETPSKEDAKKYTITIKHIGDGRGLSKIIQNITPTIKEETKKKKGKVQYPIPVTSEQVNGIKPQPPKVLSILGEGADKQTGNKIIHANYKIKVEKTEPLLIKTQTSSSYEFLDIVDENGLSLNEEVQSSELRDNMTIFIRFGVIQNE